MGNKNLSWGLEGKKKLPIQVPLINTIGCIFRIVNHPYYTTFQIRRASAYSTNTINNVSVTGKKEKKGKREVEEEKKTVKVIQRLNSNSGNTSFSWLL